MSQIIDGVALAEKHKIALLEKIRILKSENPKMRNPSIVSFCNEDDPPSVKYTYMKFQKAHELGIDFMAEPYSKETPQEQLSQLLDKYNRDQNIDGIMVQLPLPEELKVLREDLINKIDPKKDVDGLTMKGRKMYLPATVKGVFSILDDMFVDWVKKDIAMVGSEGEVGQPMVEALAERGVNITEVDRSVGEMEDLKSADIIISATGQNNLITADMVKGGVIAIDVGLGDFDSSVYKKCLAYTPAIGGVGPMTVVSLMENVIKSFQRKYE